MTLPRVAPEVRRLAVGIRMHASDSQRDDMIDARSATGFRSRISFDGLKAQLTDPVIALQDCQAINLLDYWRTAKTRAASMPVTLRGFGMTRARFSLILGDTIRVGGLPALDALLNGFWILPIPFFGLSQESRPVVEVVTPLLFSDLRTVRVVIRFHILTHLYGVLSFPYLEILGLRLWPVRLAPSGMDGAGVEARSACFTS